MKRVVVAFLALGVSLFSFVEIEGLVANDILSQVHDTKPCQSLEDIKARGKLRIGVYNDDPYFSYINPDTKELEGFDADIARAVATEMMGAPDKLEFVIIDSEKRLEMLTQGKVDIVIAELSTTDKRKEQVAFSDIYYVAGQSILVNGDSPFQTLQDLRGQTVGAVLISTNADHAIRALPDSKFRYFPTLAQGFQALQERRIQAFCIDDVMLMALKADPSRMILEFRFIGGEISWENYGIAVSKNCPGLLEAVNQAVKTIKTDGKWQEIYDRNIGRISRVSAGPPV